VDQTVKHERQTEDGLEGKFKEDIERQEVYAPKHLRTATFLSTDDDERVSERSIGILKDLGRLDLVVACSYVIDRSKHVSGHPASCFSGLHPSSLIVLLYDTLAYSLLLKEHLLPLLANVVSIPSSSPKKSACCAH